MAEFQVHISQAQHNESLAQYLLSLTKVQFHDWAITASFYSAIHYVEARFIDEADVNHSETSIPIGEDKKLEYTPHGWRQRVVRDRFTKRTWKAFRKLRETSEIARYLSYGRMGRLKGVTFERAPAVQIFQPKDAENLYNRDLQSIKEELRIELSEFLHELDMEKTDASMANLIIHTSLTHYSSKNDILQQTKSDLERFFSFEEIDFLEQHLRAKGFNLSRNS